MTTEAVHPTPTTEAWPTDAAVDERIRSLVGSALHPSQLWLMTMDAERRPDPVVMPISDIPVWPGASVLSTLEMVLAGLREAYPGRTVLFVLERFGASDVTSNDRAWASQLRRACTLAEVHLGGIWIASDDGVARMPGGRRPLTARAPIRQHR